MSNVLICSNNMVHADAGQTELFDIAVIHGASLVGSELFDPKQSGLRDPITLTLRSGEHVLSAPRWHALTWAQRIMALQAALAVFCCLPETANAVFHWQFSGKKILRRNAQDVLDQWMADQAPPMLALIDLLIEDRSEGQAIVTHGLASIFGYEVEAQIGDGGDPELARLVGRVGQSMLQFGVPASDHAIGPTGENYRLADVQDPISGSRALVITRK